MPTKQQPETKQTRAINKATETVTRALDKFALAVEKNGSCLKSVSYQWQPDSGEASKFSVRYKKE